MTPAVPEPAPRPAPSPLTSVVEAAGRGLAAVEEASRREPREAWRTIRVVGILAVLLLFVWAAWFAPWARGGDVPGGAPAAADPQLAPATRGDLERALAPLRASIEAVGARVDRLYERVPAGGGR